MVTVSDVVRGMWWKMGRLDGVMHAQTVRRCAKLQFVHGAVMLLLGVAWWWLWQRAPQPLSVNTQVHRDHPTLNDHFLVICNVAELACCTADALAHKLARALSPTAPAHAQNSWRAIPCKPPRTQNNAVDAIEHQASTRAAVCCCTYCAVLVQYGAATAALAVVCCA
jgi:hypothetical protein